MATEYPPLVLMLAPRVASGSCAMEDLVTVYGHDEDFAFLLPSSAQHSLFLRAVDEARAGRLSVPAGTGLDDVMGEADVDAMDFMGAEMDGIDLGAQDDTSSTTGLVSPRIAALSRVDSGQSSESLSREIDDIVSSGIFPPLYPSNQDGTVAGPTEPIVTFDEPLLALNVQSAAASTTPLGGGMAAASRHRRTRSEPTAGFGAEPFTFPTFDLPADVPVDDDGTPTFDLSEFATPLSDPHQSPLSPPHIAPAASFTSAESSPSAPSTPSSPLARGSAVSPPSAMGAAVPTSRRAGARHRRRPSGGGAGKSIASAAAHARTVSADSYQLGAIADAVIASVPSGGMVRAYQRRGVPEQQGQLMSQFTVKRSDESDERLLAGSDADPLIRKPVAPPAAIPRPVQLSQTVSLETVSDRLEDALSSNDLPRASTVYHSVEGTMRLKVFGQDLLDKYTTVLCLAGQVQPALEIFAAILNGSKRPPLASFNRLLHACLAHRIVASIPTLLAHMDRLDVRPDQVTMRYAVDGLFEMNMVADARRRWFPFIFRERHRDPSWFVFFADVTSFTPHQAQLTVLELLERIERAYKSKKLTELEPFVVRNVVRAHPQLGIPKQTAQEVLTQLLATLMGQNLLATVEPDSSGDGVTMTVPVDRLRAYLDLKCSE